MPRYVDALLTEAAAMAHYASAPLETAFIGGGTPSTLPAPLLEQLLNGLHQHYTIPADMEFTSEANPGTLTEDWLLTAVNGGVNRLSMGMQAAQPKLLRTLGRIHTQEDVIASVRMARRCGVSNLSLDLMFGLPGQTPEMWRESLEAALALEPQHLSCYGLIPEEGTPLVRDLDAGRLSLPHEDDERRMYDDALDLLAQHGYLQYEISNFELPGYECRHNIGYWRQAPYIGLGASAASMLPDGQGELRLTNPPALSEYLCMVEAGEWKSREVAHVSPEDARFETLMLGLRMTSGVSEADFAARHGISLETYRGERLHAFESQELMTHQDGFWRLTRRGMDVQNAILVELMDE